MPRLLLAVPLLTVGAAGARAQEIEPRAFSNIPVGVNSLTASCGLSSGGLVSHGSLPLDDADLRTDALVAAYARGIAVGGRSGKVDAIVPFAWVSGSAEHAGEPARRSVSGFGDPRVHISLNLFGAPALSVRELAAYRQDTIVGVSVQVSVPAGQYDGTRLVNIGSNRWWVKSELGVSKAIGAWMALSRTYYTGGRTTVDGVEGSDWQRNSLADLTIVPSVNRHHSVKFYANTGLATRIGSDADTLGMAWLYRWGGAL